METKTPRLIALADGIQPLQEYFNSNQAKPRFMALVSPTCAECLAGAKAVQHSILEAFPDAELSASLVWVPMLEGDNEETARLAANSIPDTRVRHFYDGANQAGKAIAGLFGVTNRLAWDIYMFEGENRHLAESPTQAPQVVSPIRKKRG